MKPIATTLVWLGLWQSAEFFNAFSPALWFPSSALTLALFLVWGRRALPVVCFAAVVASLQSRWLEGVHDLRLLIGPSVSFAVIQAAGYGAMAILFDALRRRSGQTDLSRRSVLPFLTLTPVCTGLVVAADAVNEFLAYGLPPGPLVGALVVRWLGELVSVAGLTFPMALLLGRLPGARPSPIAAWRDDGQGLRPLRTIGRAILFLSSVVSAMAVRRWGPVDLPLSCVAYLLILPLVALAHSEPPWVTIAMLALTQVMLMLASRTANLGGILLDMQSVTLILTAIGYITLCVPALRAENSHFKRLANVDYLTGIYNRRGFVWRAESEVEQARRLGQPLSLVVFDLDHFKAVNDRHGHEVGDAALVDVAQTASGALRTSDFVGRTGGEEFAICLPRTDLAAAQEVAERLRRRISSRSLAGGASVTISAGVAELADEETLPAVMRRADAALYSAKREGRNRVCMSPAEA